MSHFSHRRGQISVSFTEAEKLFLGDVLPFLAGIGEPGSDPAADRLEVPVYLDDPESSQEWWRLMGADLRAGKQADRSVFERMVGGESTVLDVDEANAVLRVLNETRLALGARLGIDVEDDHETVPDEGRQTLDYLGWIQEELTVELTKTL